MRQLHIIGGAEDKVGDRRILKGFLEAAGGRDAKILVLPIASSIGDEVAEVYAKTFYDLGAHRVRALDPETRNGADSDDGVDLVERATGIFMTGGNQAKLSAIVGGTRLHEAIGQSYSDGKPIAGTSAGASVMASHMVFLGNPGDVAKQRMVQMSAGFGLLPGTIVDQHFSQRNRMGRLMTLVAQSPSHLGIGIDEDTALVVTDEQVGEVIGKGVVIIVDGQHIYTDAYDASRSDPLVISGAIVHQLPEGQRFDLEARRLVAEIDGDTHPVTDPAQDYAKATIDGRKLRRTDLDAADDRELMRADKRRSRRR